MTTRATDKPVIVKPERWRRGDRLEARRLNQPVEAVRQLMRGVAPSRQITTTQRATAVDVRQFRIKSVSQDFLVCREWNGTSEGDADFIIAKPPLLRASATSRTANGNAITYSSVTTTGTQRVATVGAESETQVVIPSYEVNDIVYAIRNVKNGTGVTRTVNGVETDIDWLEINQARHWATKAE